jgi:alanine racemase
MSSETSRLAGGLDSLLRPAWAVVDLDALEHNLELLRRRVAPAGVLAVIKADAYGHGAPAVARLLEEKGVDWLGVALAEEGAELRRAGVETPILVLGPSHASQIPIYQRYRLLPTVSNREQLDHWAAWAETWQRPQIIHLKVDVGMHRLGLEPAELGAVLERIRDHPYLEVGGLLSHLADADDLESPRTAEQEKRFTDLVAGQLTAEERSRLQLHLANSAAALHHAATRHSFVRSGLALLGLDPAGVEQDLRPVMSVVSRIVQIREVETGARPGYGGLWRAPRGSRLGVVPVGYADGYGRRLSNNAQMLAGGRRVAVVGAVSMDMSLVDLTDTSSQAGDEVVLLGRQDDEEIGAAELAQWAGTIPYESLCLLGLRLPRCYLRQGAVVDRTSSFIVRPD